ncbi:hypothetical protein ACFWPQ_01590 [Streptomyces sp. NPDC058464]|uniref:hypothetical protein n=1 Tax=Streptomyces sp. NPDC058464 TaxID=3346511 RepID=UPI003649C170
MTEPTPLDREQLQPIAVSLGQRATAGNQSSPPSFTDCPTCGARPAALDISISDDTIVIRFLRCGHVVTADRAEFYELCRAAFQPPDKEGP